MEKTEQDEKEVLDEDELKKASFFAKYTYEKRMKKTYFLSFYTFYIKNIHVLLFIVLLYTIFGVLDSIFDWTNLASPLYFFTNAILGGGILLFYFIFFIVCKIKADNFASDLDETISHEFYFFPQSIIYRTCEVIKTYEKEITYTQEGMKKEEEKEVITYKELKQERIPYEDVTFIKESSDYFFIGVKFHPTLVVYSPSFKLNKSVVLDTLRGRLVEFSQKEIVVTSYKTNPRLEYFFDKAFDKSIKDVSLKTAVLYSLPFFLYAFVINFRDGLVLDNIWLMFFAGTFALIDLIVVLYLRYKFELGKSLKRKAAIILSAVSVLSYTGGILSSIYANLVFYTRTAQRLNKDLKDVFIPTSGQLNESRNAHSHDYFYKTYRDVTSAYLTNQTEIEKFEEQLDGPYFIATKKLTLNQQQTLPGTSFSSSTDYYCIYNKTINAYFPTKLQCKTADMITIGYQKEGNIITFFEYNFELDHFAI